MPARLAFVDRVELRLKLSQALMTPGKQVIVYGHTGSGKTSLVQHELSSHCSQQYIVSRCIAGLSFDDLVLDAFDQLDAFYTSDREKACTSSLASKLVGKYFAISGEISATAQRSTRERMSRILPPQLTPSTLGRLMGYAGYCWVLEDFHKLEESQKRILAQVMKLFMDLADEHRKLRIIALGAVDTAREVVALDGDMANRVTELHVPLMSSQEIAQIISNGQDKLNIHVPLEVRDGIVRYSNGLPAACHQLCLGMCFAAHVFETQKRTIQLGREELSISLKNYIEEASDSLKAAFDSALRRAPNTKYDNTRLALTALAEINAEGCLAADLLPIVHKHSPSYPPGQLAKFLKELTQTTRGKLLRLDRNSGRYAFANPIFQVYASALLGDKAFSSEHSTLRPDAARMTKIMLTRFVYRGLPSRVVRKATKRSL